MNKKGRQIKKQKIQGKPKGRCTCGHTGDGENSQHHDVLGSGHGRCKVCDCEQFTWAGWLDWFAYAIELGVLTRKNGNKE